MFGKAHVVCLAFLAMLATGGCEDAAESAEDARSEYDSVQIWDGDALADREAAPGSDGTPLAALRLTAPTTPPTETGPADVSAFIPTCCDEAWRACNDEGFWVCELTCPGLEALELCGSFRTPDASAQALDPWLPIIVISQGDSGDPEGCACEGGLWVDDELLPFGEDGEESCLSAVVLDDGAPRVIQNPVALADTFGPVTSPEEALAFFDLLRPGISRTMAVRHIYDDADLYALRSDFAAFYGDFETATCLQPSIEGTHVETVASGYIVHTYAIGRTCSWAGLYQFRATITSSGMASHSEGHTVCHFKQAPCVN